MGNISKGVVAGLAGTAALSILMVMKSMMGVMPQLDVIGITACRRSSPSA